MWIGVLNTLYFVCPYFLASFVHFWIAGGILSGTRAKHHRWHLYKWNTVLRASEDLRSQSRTKSEKIITVHLVLRYIWCKLTFLRYKAKNKQKANTKGCIKSSLQPNKLNDHLLVHLHWSARYQRKSTYYSIHWIASTQKHCSLKGIL